jgi:hypothetical protein
MEGMTREVARTGTSLANASISSPDASLFTRSGAASGNGNGKGVVIHQTNYYTVTVDDLQDLNDAVDFVSNLDKERQLMFSS